MGSSVSCQVSGLGNIFAPSNKSTHQLNIHVQLIGYLHYNFILVAGPVFRPVKLSVSWIIIIISHEPVLSIPLTVGVFSGMQTMLHRVLGLHVHCVLNSNHILPILEMKDLNCPALYEGSKGTGIGS